MMKRVRVLPARAYVTRHEVPRFAAWQRGLPKKGFGILLKHQLSSAGRIERNVAPAVPRFPWNRGCRNVVASLLGPAYFNRLLARNSEGSPPGVHVSFGFTRRFEVMPGKGGEHESGKKLGVPGGAIQFSRPFHRARRQPLSPLCVK